MPHGALAVVARVAQHFAESEPGRSIGRVGGDHLAQSVGGVIVALGITESLTTRDLHTDVVGVAGQDGVVLTDSQVVFAAGNVSVGEAGLGAAVGRIGGNIVRLAIERAASRNAGCAVTSFTASPSTKTRRPSLSEAR